MQIEPFALERWFATHEADNLMLAESGIRPLDPTRFDSVARNRRAQDHRSDSRATTVPLEDPDM